MRISDWSSDVCSSDLFPGYLANGYFSTMTSPRGTEPNAAYMVAFMDYKPGDISRTAAIPGWSENDYNPGGGGLNRTRLEAGIFRDYAQPLDLHDATLRTRYRFADDTQTSDTEQHGSAPRRERASTYGQTP